MARIFLTLAALNSLTLCLAIFGGFQAAHAPESPTGLALHFLFALFSSIFAILTHCIVFTYFLGTGRWVKEVTYAYQLPEEPWHATTRRFKRAVFPFALLAIGATMASALTGAGVNALAWPRGVHGALAFATLLVNVLVFRREARFIRRNGELMHALARHVEARAAQSSSPGGQPGSELKK